MEVVLGGMVERLILGKRWLLWLWLLKEKTRAVI